MTRNAERRRRAFGIVVLTLFTVILLYNALFSFSYSVGPNYINVSVDTRVNITNSLPEVLSVIVTDPITLNAGSTVTVWCNATVRDWNGGDTIVNVTARLWDNASTTAGAPLDNNDHYFNSNCTNVSVNGYYANFTCNFSIWYYANNGSDWICNITATDTFVFNASVGSDAWNFNTTTVNSLLALNISTELIDYGDMSVGDTSAIAEEANVTNYGNQDINISVKGYGVTEGDGLAFNCSVGTITIDNERFSMNATGDYLVDYTSLTSNFQQIPALTMPQQVVDGTPVENSTYWKLYVPPNPFGLCNGTVVFQAEAAS